MRGEALAKVETRKQPRW